MLLSGRDSLREVIAFPKSGGGFDPLTQAPAPITAQQRKEAGVGLRRRQAAVKPDDPAGPRAGGRARRAGHDRRRD